MVIVGGPGNGKTAILEELLDLSIAGQGRIMLVQKEGKQFFLRSQTFEIMFENF